MKRTLFTILCLSTTVYASHTYISDNLACTYHDLTVPNSRPKTSTCHSFIWESMQIYDEKRGGYIAGNGEEYTLKNKKTITFSYEAFMKTKKSNPTDGKWTHSTKLMNGKPYTTTERTVKGWNWTCHRSEKEELCVRSQVPSYPQQGDTPIIDIPPLE